RTWASVNDLGNAAVVRAPTGPRLSASPSGTMLWAPIHRNSARTAFTPTCNDPRRCSCARTVTISCTCAAVSEPLRPVTFGWSSDLQVGQPVVAIGSPLGLSGTVTSGIVSALNRPVRTGDAQRSGQDTVIDAVQTDAAINPGNSGGPLVNMQGEVVGVNTAIASLGAGPTSESGSIGLGFAIPNDEAQPIAQQLAQNGKASHAQLGVSVRDTERGGQLMQVQARASRKGRTVRRGRDRQGRRPAGGRRPTPLVATVRAHRPA